MWRICRDEYKFTSYTLNNVFTRLFGIVKPMIPNSYFLERYLKTESSFDKAYVFTYILDRLLMCQQIIESIGLVQRTIEMAKVFTVNFESVLTRG